MKRCAIVTGAALAAGVVLGGEAHAQQYNWSGVYIGINAGGAFGKSQFGSTPSCPDDPNMNYWYCGAAMPLGLLTDSIIAASGTGTASSRNWTGGGQFGVQWQTGSIVMGAEVEYGRLGFKVDRAGTSTFPYGNGAVNTTSSKLAANDLAILRGRLGWAVSNVLLYATAGAAFSKLQLSTSFRDNVVSNGAVGMMDTSNTAVKIGWTVGGGVEWGLTQNWSVKGEYVFVGFPSISARGTVTHADFIGQYNYLTTAADLNLHLVRAGLNYRF